MRKRSVCAEGGKVERVGEEWMSGTSAFVVAVVFVKLKNKVSPHLHCFRVLKAAQATPHDLQQSGVQERESC